MSTFYRAELIPEEDGLVMRITTYVSIHESMCYHWCITERDAEYAKRWGWGFKTIRKRRRVRKIDKGGSRIAQPTKKEAVRALCCRKQAEIHHSARKVDLARAFLNAVEGLDDWEPVSGAGDRRLVPDTRELIREHYIFD